VSGSRLRTMMAVALAPVLGVALAGRTPALASPLARTAVARPVVTDPGRLSDPGVVLGPHWRASRDRVMTVAGDATGMHVLVANASYGYAWHTVATLTVPGVDTSEWVGQACLTGGGPHSGRHRRQPGARPDERAADGA
jgi:hypothetical protein